MVPVCTLYPTNNSMHVRIHVHSVHFIYTVHLVHVCMYRYILTRTLVFISFQRMKQTVVLCRLLMPASYNPQSLFSNNHSQERVVKNRYWGCSYCGRNNQTSAFPSDNYYGRLVKHTQNNQPWQCAKNMHMILSVTIVQIWTVDRLTVHCSNMGDYTRTKFTDQCILIMIHTPMYVCRQHKFIVRNSPATCSSTIPNSNQTSN